MAELRAEVDRVFEEARSELATRMSGPMPVASPPPPPPGMPPPPPRPPDASVWAGLERGVETASDPITAFAPGPRMDWGPERPARRRGLFRRASGATA